MRKLVQVHGKCPQVIIHYDTVGKLPWAVKSLHLKGKKPILVNVSFLVPVKLLCNTKKWFSAMESEAKQVSRS